ncbi:hypothetical protein DERP_010445 [Dermatophagoides pteronyssinus]|uniref:Uncharacterized protein n=1 Tax=Dermatophagoides pteronyssinus TaxID=6956 RepID=A0ABQ8J505_DERPT|nr:hypothetical protein DERP_010445 [Dermatophagoides pteronyssinus]
MNEKFGTIFSSHAHTATMIRVNSDGGRDGGSGRHCCVTVVYHLYIHSFDLLVAAPTIISKRNSWIILFDHNNYRKEPYMIPNFDTLKNKKQNPLESIFQTHNAKKSQLNLARLATLDNN